MDDETKNNNAVNTIVGTSDSDALSGTDKRDDIDGEAGDDKLSGGKAEDKLLGGEGSDRLDAGQGNDLAAGDYVGEEWSLVDGKWVYDPSKVQYNEALETTDDSDRFNDVITTGDGEDVLLGNRGHDILSAGAGEDRINAGTGDDFADGGDGDDKINLGRGDDVAHGGMGADIINAGDGDDVVYGDTAGQNLIDDGAAGSKPTSMSQYADTGNWTVSDMDGFEEMSRSIETNAGESYNLSFDLAANTAAGSMTGTVEILWNGEVVETVSTQSGVFEQATLNVTGTGGADVLTFRVIEAENTYDGPEIDTSGDIFTYEKTVEFGGQEVTLDAFAPGQANLYQVIDGQLKVFDPIAEEYLDSGAPAAFKVNAVGYNIEDDLIYGVAKSSGTDALGNAVTAPDLVAMDAQGNAYRVGGINNADFVGDFDTSGNLWTFDASLNRITKIDVDQLDANGNAVTVDYDIPNDLLTGNIYDIAYNANENAFYAVQAPSKNGGEGKIMKIDLNNLDDGGAPEVTSIPLTGTLIDGDMATGMVKGAYGAVFMDGDGNLFIGLNRGDHDLDGSTDASGAVYQVHYDFKAGYGYAEFKSEAQNTGSNDGAVDSRSIDPFQQVDTDATILIKDPVLTSNEGGDDKIRGGEGDDTLYGEAGNDTIFGGNDDDFVDGGIGNDKLFGGQGDDTVIGGTGDDILKGAHGDDTLEGGAGNDKIFGGAGADTLSGGEGDDKMSGGGGADMLDGGDGQDMINGAAGNDILDGGAGNDKVVGGSGSDVISGGAGDDHLWGGNWNEDGSSDTFVMAQGSGKDMVHDFETDQDVVDLSAYGLEFSDLAELMDDQGWATVIDLSGLEGGQEGDKLILKSVSPEDLDESNFVL